MTISPKKMLQVAQENDAFAAELILTLNTISNAVKALAVRVKALEQAREQEHPTAKTLKLVHDGS